MDEVKEALGIDKADTSVSLILVEESHNSDARFVLHAIVSHCIAKNNPLCLVLLHSTFGHYHNVGMKLGYNLLKLRDCSSVRLVESLKAMGKSMLSTKEDECGDKDDFRLDVEEENSRDFVERLIDRIRRECKALREATPVGKIYLIIDDLSHLVDVGLEVEEVWLFLRHLRSLVAKDPEMTLCVASHVYKSTTESIVSLLRYFADVIVRTEPLETGRSRNVSGKMSVCWRSERERLRFKWPKEMIHLYKLDDRQAKLFAPGSLYV